MNYIISQYLVFEKNDQGGILPETRWDRRTRLYNEGRAEAVSNWNRYQEDEKVLTNLNKKLQENGQTITDNAERQKIADKVLKNASERAKDYGNQIVANTKTLSDFKKENEVENPNKQVKPKFTDGLKSFASSALSSIGNAVISAGTAMIAQQLISWGLQGIDAIVHYDDNIIAKGQEAKESIQSQTKAYEDQKASLGELTSKYTELSKGVKISGNSIKNISLTDDEYKDFLDTSNQIAAAAPSLTRSWDSQGNAILNAGTNAEDLNTQVNDYLKLQRNLTYYDTKKNISDQYKGYETALGKNKGKQDEYKNAYDAAKYKVDSVQKFSDMLKKHTKGEDTITYTLDQTAYDALGNTFGKAIKGYKQSADGQKITLEFDGKQLDFLNSEAASVLNSDNSELQEAHTNLVNTQESIDASKREMVSSIKSMASTIDSFDSWDDQDKASEFQSQLNSMLSSSDGTRLLDNFEQSGKDMDTWLRNNVVNPMATATPDQQKLWSQLFEMEPKDQETVREFAARRDDVLESIADISQSDFWTKGTLAEAFGFAHTEYDDNDKAYTVWENQDSLNRVRDALKGAKASKTKGDAEKVREDLKNATQDELEIAVQVITDNKDLGSIDDFYTAFEKAKQAAKDMSDQAAVSLDSMETKVSTAKSTLSSMGTILTETTSAGGISKDNVKILSTAFKDVKDPRGIEQNVNDLFTTTSDGIKLNIDALKTFTEYQAEATDGDFEKGIKLQTKAIAEQAEETDKAWKAIAKADDKEAARATYNAEKDKLKDARDEYLSYMQSQSEWQATKKQQQELLSYYSQWQRAQSTENAGDKYNNIVAGLKNAKDAYDKGLVGTDDFKSFAALISPTGSDDRANFAENYGKAVRYLTEDKTGVNNFLADLKSKGMASYDDASKRWSFDIDDMSKAARSMGISKEFMSANFGRLRDYGIDNNFISSIEEGIDRTQELTSALSDEQKRLEELKNTDSTNTTAISASEDKVNKYKQDLKETYDNMESYSEDAAQNAIDNFNSSAMGAQAYEEEIKRVQKNDQLTNDQRNAAINQLKAKQEELAASAGTTVEALLGTDVSSLMDGIITDSASVTITAMNTHTGPGKTKIDGGIIETNTITADSIKVDAIRSKIFEDDLTSNYSLKGIWFDLSENGAIKGKNFAVDSNGNAYIRGDSTVEGTIIANKGYIGGIGGFHIEAGKLYSGMDTFPEQPTSISKDKNVYIGTDGIALGSGNFRVDSNGKLYANSGTFSGTIYADGGTIGGWSISANSLSNRDGSISLNPDGLKLGNQLNIDNQGNATFGGKLSAATGSFSGELVAATGSFSGELKAARGSFKGELSGATGSFTGSVIATSITAKQSYSIYYNDVGTGEPTDSVQVITAFDWGTNTTQIGFGLIDSSLDSSKMHGMLLIKEQGARVLTLIADDINTNGWLNVNKLNITDSLGQYKGVPYKSIMWKPTDTFDFNGYNHHHTILPYKNGNFAVGMESTTTGMLSISLLPYLLSTETDAYGNITVSKTKDTTSQISIGATANPYACIYVDAIYLTGDKKTYTSLANLGEGGTTNYNGLTNKPKINNVELASGNNTLSNLGIAARSHSHSKLNNSSPVDYKGFGHCHTVIMNSNHNMWVAINNDGTPALTPYKLKTSTSYTDVDTYSLEKGGTCNLGSTDAPWNAVYAKNYYDEYGNKISTGGGSISLKIDGTTRSSGFTNYNLATQDWVTGKGYLTQHQSLYGYATTSWVSNNFAPKGSGGGTTYYAGSGISISGTTISVDYNDLYVRKIYHSSDTSYYAGVTSNGSARYFGCNYDQSLNLGDTSCKWKNIWGKNGNITGSDEELKTQMSKINDIPNIESIYMKLNPIKYKYKNFDSEEDHDRFHFGFGARETEKIFNDNNLDTSDYGLICKDILLKPNKAGNIVEYALRYGEFIALNTHMTQKAHHRIDSLESENQSLKNEILMLQGQLSLITQRLQKMEEKLC